MPQQRIAFCGVIVGSVARRKGESKADAILRAEDVIQRVLKAHAKRFGIAEARGAGPTIGLEPEDGEWEDTREVVL